MKKLIATSLLSMTISLPTLADCGETPVMSGKVPAGETASADEIRAVRTSVLAWSDRVDQYIACMDRAGAKLLPWLTKEQQQRREEDLANLHNVRRETQIALNNAIRAFRPSNSSQARNAKKDSDPARAAEARHFLLGGRGRRRQ